jgi:hypothetical protein
MYDSSSFDTNVTGMKEHGVSRIGINASDGDSLFIKSLILFVKDFTCLKKMIFYMLPVLLYDDILYAVTPDGVE